MKVSGAFSCTFVAAPKMDVRMDAIDEDEDHNGDKEMDRTFEAPADRTPALPLAAADMEVGEIFIDAISSMVPQEAFPSLIGVEAMIPDLNLELDSTRFDP